MDQARTLTATFDEEEPTGGIGVYPSGTSFPWEIATISNPSGELSFKSSCPYMWFVFGQDIGVVDPCSGIVLQTLDIPFDVFSTTAGSNGGFALKPVNGMNYLILKSQSGKSIATIENDINGDLEITEFNTDNAAGNIHAAGPNITGGASNVVSVQDSPFRYVESISMDMNSSNGYPSVGTPLLFAVGEGGTTGNWSIQGSIRQAYTKFENDTPQDIVGTYQISENGTLSMRAFYAKRTSLEDYEVISGPEIGGESNDFTCEDNPNQNPASDEAIKLCFSVDRTSDGIRPVAVYDDEANPIEVKPLVSTTSSPIVVASRLVPGGIEVISASFFGGQVYRAIFTFNGLLIASTTGSYPSNVDGVEDIKFDPFDVNRAIILGRNTNNIAVVDLPAF
jgi:hypothetical protein